MIKKQKKVTCYFFFVTLQLYTKAVSCISYRRYALINIKNCTMVFKNILQWLPLIAETVELIKYRFVFFEGKKCYENIDL